jgi:hypothetical protein
MEVHLQEAGADGIHQEKQTAELWKELNESVRKWDKEAVADALSGLSLGGSSVSVSTASATTATSSTAAATGSGKPLTDEQKAWRKTIRDVVLRSRRAHGAIFRALPEDLRVQVAHLPQGWAYGLWHWLEQKFQSTEKDSVAALLTRWIQLKQEDDESFDAYRGRVNQTASLLTLAKQKQTGDMMIVILLHRLLPHYQPAVMALQNGPRLADPDNVDWDAVAQLINAHERTQDLLAAGGAGDAQAMIASYAGRTKPAAKKAAAAATPAATAPTGRSSSAAAGERVGPPFPRSDVHCYTCGQFGHIGAYCPTKAQHAQHAQQQQLQTARGGHTGAAAGAGRGRGGWRGRGGKPPGQVQNVEAAAGSDDEDDDAAVHCRVALCLVGRTAGRSESEKLS